MFARFAKSPRVPVWTAAVVAVLVLVARKPWTLTTPQLYAEDGTIHLNENDQFGWHALFMPYRGYLHMIPRLVAWLASHTADVVHWPLIYNFASLLVTALLFVRFASPRLALPGKPWLVLAFVLVAHSGEIFLNLTNLHWLTGFFFVLQALIDRPTTVAQRVGDLTLVVLAGLTDPSAIIFFPLLAWRWWRERHADNLAVLLLAGICAAVQAGLLATTGPHMGADTAPLHLFPLVATASCRLIIWPFFGAHAVELLPAAAQVVIAGIAFGVLLFAAARPHERRPLRLTVLAAWTMISFAGVFRTRPDTWPVEFGDLGYAEPYFYMPRLLLVWLVIWEFDARLRAVALLARATCMVGALTALPDARVPAPIDYHWAENCEPVRRGVPANIPTLPEGWTLEYHGRPQGR